MMESQVEVTPWENQHAPSEEEIRNLLAEEDLRPYRWSNGPHDTYAAHRHGYHKVIYVVEGSITFGLPATGESVDLKAGDRMDLPAGIEHDAVVGPEGVVCLEAHRNT